MKKIKKESEKRVSKKPGEKAEPNKIKPKIKKKVFENLEDVQRLVHLLQVHQVELEHQNEELRITQAELEVSRNKYVNLFDFSPTPYFTLDQESIIKEVNLIACKMLAIDRNKLVGKSFNTYILLEERDVFNSFIKNVFNTPGKHSTEIKVMNKDKRVFYVLLEGLKLDDLLESEQKCQIALIDLTEYKRISDSLKKSTEELETLDSTKDKFFSIIAHDLRSPFQALLSSTELLSTEIATLSHEDIITMSSALNDNFKNLLTLLDNLLQWSLIQRNKLDYVPINLKLSDLVNKIIETSNQGAKKKNISIYNNVNAGTLVYADVDMLRIVVQNLITNAIKFTNAGGKIIVSSIEKDDFVEFSVRDSGVGIESERASKLFNFAALASATGTAGERGTGLGLPLCKEFVERNDGKIWVESELGKGTKFTFTLHKSN